MKTRSRKLWLVYLVFYLALISLACFFHQHDLNHDLNCAICNWLSNFQFIPPVTLSFLLLFVIFSFILLPAVIFQSQLNFQSFNPVLLHSIVFLYKLLFLSNFSKPNLTRSENEVQNFHHFSILFG